MTGDWLAAVPALIAAVAVLFGPGFAMGAGLRLRGLALWALAPVLSVALIAGLAFVYGLVRIPWSLGSILGGTAAVVVLAWLAGLLLGPRVARPPRDVRWTRLLAGGLVVGALLTAARFLIYLHDPAAISMTNDAVFHLNAVRYVLETGSASSLHISGVVGGSGFYPAAWHGIASTVVLITGASIPVAANMVSLVIAAGVWTLGIAWFARSVTGAPSATGALAASLSASLPVFPMLMFQWGVLYSYALALALVPAAAALIIDAPRWFAGRGPVRGTARTAALLAVLVVAAAGALALSQPAVLLTWGILVITWFSWWAISTAVASSGRRRMLLLAAVGGAWAVFVTVWILLTRSTSGSHWPPFRGKLEAVLDVVLNGQVLLPVMAGVSILMLVGLVVSVRRPPLRWLATAWVVSGSLYVVSAGIGNPFLRRWLLGAWYADPYRIAAAGAVVVVPLAAIGLAVIATWAAQAISARRGETAARFGAAWAIVAVAALGVILLIAAPMLQLRGVTDREIDTESRYATDEYLSPDERVLLERLDEHVPPGERVIGNPSTGMGFAYMLSAADVFPRTWAAPRTDPWRMIEQSLRQAGSDPAVCEALAAYGSPTYVLDFGLGEDSPGRYELPGMTGFEGKRGFELVDEQGDASLWRITACAP